MVASEASLLLLLLEYFASQKLANRHKHSSGIHADHLKGGAKVEGRREEPRIEAKTRMGRRGSRKDAKTQRRKEQTKRLRGNTEHTDAFGDTDAH